MSLRTLLTNLRITKKFLKEKAPGKYCVLVDYDWCVRVVSLEYAREHMPGLENYLVR